jgi:RpiR family carbohydrate utilization transcriptional regulator
MASLEVARQSVCVNTVNRVVDLLTQAQRISFFGLGASASVAHDALNKFFRFNVPVVYFEDILMQRMSCMNCGSGDVVVLISHTGRTKSLVEIAQIAKNNDATVVGITSANSPLAQECTFVLSLEVPEDTDMYMPMASRIAQLTLIDVLATGFTLRRGNKFRVKDTLRGSRFEKRGG